MRDLVRSYYAQIRSLLRDRSDLRPCLKHCEHCGILFFTDPRNAGRDDLRCGFGCRERHRRTSSTRRSVEFHREHKDKKRALNRRRYLLSAQASLPNRVERQSPGEAEGPADDGTGAAPIIQHVRMLISLIEGRRVELREIMDLLARKGRQHSMARSGRQGYGGRRIRDHGS